jgi:hypothetical protein
MRARLFLALGRRRLAPRCAHSLPGFRRALGTKKRKGGAPRAPPRPRSSLPPRPCPQNRSRSPPQSPAFCGPAAADRRGAPRPAGLVFFEGAPAVLVGGRTAGWLWLCQPQAPITEAAGLLRPSARAREAGTGRPRPCSAIAAPSLPRRQDQSTAPHRQQLDVAAAGGEDLAHEARHWRRRPRRRDRLHGPSPSRSRYPGCWWSVM